MLEVKTMTDDFENFNDEHDDWLSELEISDTDLENELYDWRAAHAQELAETSYDQDGAPARTRPGMLRAQPRPSLPRQAQPRQAQPRQAQPRQAPSRQAPSRQAQQRQAAARQAPSRRPPSRQVPPRHLIEEEPEDEFTAIIQTGAGPDWPDPGHGTAAEERTQAIIDRGRRSVSRVRKPRSRKVLYGVAAAVAVVMVASVLFLRSSPSWPPSVATVQGQITTACQNPN